MRDHGGCDAYRITAVSSSLVDSSQRGEFLHDFPSTSESCYGKSSPQDLSQYGQVGSDPEIFLSATESNSESRDHFVENQDDSVLFGDFSQCLLHSRSWKDGSHVSHYWIDNYGC